MKVKVDVVTRWFLNSYGRPEKADFIQATGDFWLNIGDGKTKYKGGLFETKAELAISVTEDARRSIKYNERRIAEAEKWGLES